MPDLLHQSKSEIRYLCHDWPTAYHAWKGAGLKSRPGKIRKTRSGEIILTVKNEELLKLDPLDRETAFPKQRPDGEEAQEEAMAKICH